MLRGLDPPFKLTYNPFWSCTCKCVNNVLRNVISVVLAKIRKKNLEQTNVS